MKEFRILSVVVATLLIGLSACGRAPLPIGHELLAAYDASYASGGGTRVTFENDPDSKAGSVTWYYVPGFIPETAGHPAMSEGLGRPLRECSDANTRCIFIGDYVFAHPRDGFQSKSKLTVGGATFTVLDCVDPTSQTCDAALVRSECAWIIYGTSLEDGPVGCSSYKPAANGEKGGAAIYVVDRTRGVMWWDVSEACISAPSRQSCPGADAFMLTSAHGLLSNPAEF